MELPITESELGIIIEKLRSSNPQLYAKLWSHKMNILNKEKKNEKTNFSI
jgi:hypothetical protein